MSTPYEITFWSTGEPWDAPIVRYTFPDGTMQVRRDDEEPGREWTGRLTIAHGVVKVDGIMSEFDRARQPPRHEIPRGPVAYR